MIQHKPAIAHVRGGDQKVQALQTHLRGVSALSKQFAGKIGLSDHGALIGLLHDLGKYSNAFQNYIQSVTGLLNQDEDEEFVDAANLRGQIDHSTAGAQFIWREFQGGTPIHLATGQILALCIASHHSGLIDCLSSSAGQPAENLFLKRITSLTPKRIWTRP